MRGYPKAVTEEAARTGDSPVPKDHTFGWVVRDIIARNGRLYTVGHKASLAEWRRLMKRFEPKTKNEAP